MSNSSKLFWRTTALFISTFAAGVFSRGGNRYMELACGLFFVISFIVCILILLDN